MHVFLCHTPLHILLSQYIEEGLEDAPRARYVVVEDYAGLHAFARSILDHAETDVLYLPGKAQAQSRLQRTLLQRANARLLQRRFAGLRCMFYLFNDLLPEPQALLNLAVRQSPQLACVLLEDGVALYGPRGTGRNRLADTVMHKLAFGLRWKHAHAIGLHPAITEIRCFYPQLVHPELRGIPAAPLPTGTPASLGKLRRDLALPALRDSAVLALPHSAYTEPALMTAFVAACAGYCRRMQLAPVIKAHPGDSAYKKYLAGLDKPPRLLPGHLPLEAVLLCSDHPAALIGFRTSALHITRALLPDVTCLYFEHGDSLHHRDWVAFLDRLGVIPLPPA